MQNRNQSIEFVRTIACVFVVFIHVRFPSPCGLWIVGIGRFAVPFFAMVSGYYCHAEDKNGSLQRIKKNLIGILRITALASILAVISNSAASLIAGHGLFNWLQEYISRRTILHFVLFNRALFLNSAMWYLFAMIYSYFLLYVLIRFDLTWVSLLPAFLLIALNLYFCEFSGRPWYYCGNYLFEILPLLIIGFHFEKLKRIRIPFPWQMILLSTGIVLSIAEVSAFYDDAPMYIGSTTSAFMLLYICTSNASMRSNPVSRVGTRWTMLIYILHCCVRVIFNASFPVLASAWYYPLVILTVSAAAAAIYSKFTRKT